MGTRSAILAQTVKNGKYEGFYCQRDGYLCGVGYTLCGNYPDLQEVEALMDMCRYGCFVVPRAADFCSSNENICNSENRIHDVTEAETPEEVVNSLPSLIEYIYLWDIDVGEWSVAVDRDHYGTLFLVPFDKDTTEEELFEEEDEEEIQSEDSDEDETDHNGENHDEDGNKMENGHKNDT